MQLPSTSATIVLERPFGADECGGRSTGCAAAPVETVDGPAAEASPTGTGGVGFLLRAPGLAVLAAVFLIEGYRWLGVLHAGGSALGSWLFGTVGLALVALAAPPVALLLVADRKIAGLVVVEDLVVAVACAVAVVTGTALVVGGPVWGKMAGTSDLILAAVALGAVVLGERARHRAPETRTGRPSPIG